MLFRCVIAAALMTCSLEAHAHADELAAVALASFAAQVALVAATWIVARPIKYRLRATEASIFLVVISWTLVFTKPAGRILGQVADDGDLFAFLLLAAFLVIVPGISLAVVMLIRWRLDLDRSKFHE
jgi:hypothetical protein